MKKTNSMRVAVIMRALTLITCCLVGNTFAKYTVGGNGADSARVAKFGVEITADGNAFATAYDDGVEAKSVISTEKVVAPGTTGKFAALAIKGAPEVAVEVAYSATLTLENWADADGNYYCPIEIKVGAVTYKGTDYDDADAFKTAVENAVNTTTAYAAGADLGTAETTDISWTWAFEGNDDVKDTYLGNQANATIALTVSATVTQVD